MRTARLVAQAKVNLLLRVLARETTGYHGLETIFLRLELGDRIAVRATTGGRSLDVGGPALPAEGLGPVERNLAWRAAEAYANATGWPNGFAIEIEKQVPSGAGLGGGSADAGAVLRALDALAPAPLGRRLVELAAPLGADVPFLTIDSPMAVAWGRGERLLPQPAPALRDVLLLVPGFAIATKDAYEWLAASRAGYAPLGSVLHPASIATWEGIAGIAANDFEPIVGAHHPWIGEAVGGLRSAGAVVAMMSGSGSAVFGVFDGAPPAAVAAVRDARVLRTRTAERVVRVEVVE